MEEVMTLKTIEDLVHLDDAEFQIILRSLDAEELAIALKGVSPQFIEKTYKNMSTKAVESIKARIEALGPVKLGRVMVVHEAILGKAREAVPK
ncbi:MAG: hypothetical protein CVV44_17450 [Spirochaetae bacterium HGW-Spirochaetae-1]|jgi:flagellar motor switch protein FliG|nr:MAG: hypothetical protein CVV44_17450 [Spirochaetae bacterium HGW-Spirochaetae-1]